MPSSIIVGYMWQIFWIGGREGGGLFDPLHIGIAPKKPILNRVNIKIKSASLKLSCTEPSLKDLLIALVLQQEV